MRPNGHTAAVDAVVTTIYRLTMAVVLLCFTVLIPNQLYARDDGRFANSPLKEWFDRLASGTDYAALLPMESVCRTSIGTHRKAIIVSEFTENGSWCRTQPL
jgi:hypothetical protein